MGFFLLVFLFLVVVVSVYTSRIFGWFLVCIAGASYAQSSLEPETTEDVRDERWVEVTDTLSLDEILDVAVKFFPVVMIDDNDKLIGQMCVIHALHSKTDADRDKRLENFCAGVIFQHTSGAEFDIHSEYIEALKEVSEMNLGTNKQDRLLRAQGALMMLMRENQKLRQLVLFEYEKQKHMLHFHLRP